MASMVTYTKKPHDKENPYVLSEKRFVTFDCRSHGRQCFSFACFSDPATADYAEQVEAEADIRTSSGGYEYVLLEDGTASVAGYQATSQGYTELRIPSELDGYAVTQLSEEAFAGNTTVDPRAFPRKPFDHW